jgi:hypothetical protein
MSTKKSNFAAAAFLSSAEKQPETFPAQVAAAPNAETKTRRVQLLMKPSSYEKLKRMANRQQCSVNSVIEALIAAANE